MYCRKCGKPITSIVTECPYCHEKVIENIKYLNNVSNNSRHNKQNSYNKPFNSSVGSVIAIICIIIGIIITIKTFFNSMEWANNYYGMNPTERQGTGTTSSKTYK